MRVKHFTGYGCVDVTRVKDKEHKLHLHVEGNHEWGLARRDLDDVYHWIVRRFDKTIKDSTEWWRMHPTMTITHGMNGDVETADYIFDY